MRKYVIIGLGLIVVLNAFIIYRDKQLFKAYDACMKSINHSDCPYKK
jgi:hypothetical protein